MYRIEKIGENCLYIKAIGTLPPPEAEKFIQDFKYMTEKLEQFSVLIDTLDFTLLNFKSFEMILGLLKEDNEKLIRSAFVIAKNPPLESEFGILLDRAENPKRKIVNNLDDAKEWIGISEIVIKRD
jgi:hypothetical protein